MNQLNNRSVVVTGAGGVLGNAVAHRFFQNTDRVTGIDLQFKDSCDWKTLEGNLTDFSATESLVQSVQSDSESVDILIHCIGGFRFGSVTDLSVEDFDFLVNVNLKSTFNVLKAVLPVMKQRKFGRIVLIGANASLDAGGGMGPYAASKLGVNALVRSISKEVNQLDINVNAVLPSIIDTPTNRSDMSDADFSQWVTPEALADVIFTLCGPSGNPINGSLIPVVGGLA